jgi:hypothetical protein
LRPNGSLWRKAAVRECGISLLTTRTKQGVSKNRGFYRALARGSDKED